ncbi:MAG: glycosyltransferase family 39 protein, partial [Chloroflexi bacterium]|nr:glycosyltransferase family 39 protein [Chloroflexota bacterium]
GEPHTPLVYAVGRLWNFIVGGIDSLFALRYLSVLGNSIGIAAIFALAWRLSRTTSCALLAALLWALHPFEIWHSQEFRNYGYWGGLSATSLWLGLRLVDRPQKADWRLYTLIGGFAALSIYTESFSTVALACFALVMRWRDWDFLRRLLVIQFIMAALLITGLLLIQVQHGFLGYYPGLVQTFSVIDYIHRFVPVLSLGSTIPFDQSMVGVGLSLVCLLLAVVLYRRSPRQFRFVILAGMGPLVLLGVVSQRYNLFHPRYVLSAVPAFILVYVLGSHHVARFLRRYIGVPGWLLSVLLLLPWFVLALSTIDAYFNNPAFRKAPAWDQLGAFLNSRVTENDLVIQLSVDPAFGYYYDGPARDIGLPVKSYQPVAEIESSLELHRQRFSSIYVVAREQAGWQNAGAVSEWMRDNMQEVLRTDVAGLPVRQYKSWTVLQNLNIELARFDATVALLTAENCPLRLPTGEWLLHLHWRPLSTTARPLKTFVHAYGAYNPAAGSNLWTQDDQYPQEGRLDSTTWNLDAAFRDVYYLPAQDLAAGQYEIRVGWYDAASGERLALVDGGNSFVLCTAEVGHAD